MDFCQSMTKFARLQQENLKNVSQNPKFWSLVILLNHLGRYFNISEEKSVKGSYLPIALVNLWHKLIF